MMGVMMNDYIKRDDEGHDDIKRDYEGHDDISHVHSPVVCPP